MKWPCVVMVAVGCSSSHGTDVTGPFTGDVHRFAIDSIAVPRTQDQVTQLADDLDGDGTPDNQIGLVGSTLVVLTDATMNAQDMVDSGALASFVEIQADDVVDDPAVGVSWFGAHGDVATVAGGAFVGGVFASNRSRTTHAPGAAVARLPMFENADPLALPMAGVEIDLTPDGAGGYDAVVHGAVATDDARGAGFAGLVQMFEANPVKHSLFERGLDADRDGVLTLDEFDADPLIASFLAPDVQMFDDHVYAPTPNGAPDSLSVGFGAHLVPCDDGCPRAPPADGCHDRAVDGDETDVDCGGSCARCPASKGCKLDGDCQSTHCDAGSCRAPSCSDGVRDGYESDVDCGASCAGCAAGLGCFVPADCASGACNQTAGQPGTCM
jgi:hypothetical protein